MANSSHQSNGTQNAQLVHLNVGGRLFTTTKETLTQHPDCTLYNWFNQLPEVCPLPRDEHGRYFIDRDGDTFRKILDYLRNGDRSTVIAPDSVEDRTRVKVEATYYGLKTLANQIRTDNDYVTIGYHGTFSFGRQGISADINFRKVMRILVCGRVSVCRGVYGEALNEGRDPDRGENEDRYTARFYLKHSCLEQAFDSLAVAGFRMVGSCGTGTNGPPVDLITGSKVAHASSEEDRWAHYNEFVFCRS